MLQHELFIVVYYYYRFHCHGNVHVNDYSKSHRSIPIAWRVILSPIHVCCRQSVCDDIIDVIITSILDGIRCLEDQVCRQSVGM